MYKHKYWGEEVILFIDRLFTIFSGLVGTADATFMVIASISMMFCPQLRRMIHTVTFS